MENPNQDQPRPEQFQTEQSVPGPQQPIAPQHLQPVVPKKPMNPKTKKMIILICSIGGGLLLLGIAAIIVLPIILKIDYKKTYELAGSAREFRSDIQDYDSCGGVISYVDSSYQSASKYEGYVSTCKSDLADFKKSIESLSGDAGIQRNTEISGEWQIFKTSYDATLPAYEKLIDIYSSWHTFVAGWANVTNDSDWHETMNQTKVQNLTSSLTSSDNETLKKFGEGYIEARWKQIDAYQAYNKASDAYFDASFSAPNKTSLRNDMNAKREVYSNANQAYTDYIEDEPDINDTESLVGLDIDKNDQQFLNKFDDVYSKISAKYIEQGFKDAIGL